MGRRVGTAGPASRVSTDLRGNRPHGRDQLRPYPPVGLLDLSALTELASWERIDGGDTIRIGAGVSYTQIIEELSPECAGLALAARTVGSPQIRNRGTVGGNLATASPAGDSHPPLLACRARVEVASVRGTRLVGIDDFFVGPKCSVLAADELIRAVLVPAARGPQQFVKIGPRNAMVIATVSFAVALDRVERRVGTGIGSAGPTPLRAREAEQLVEAALADRWESPGEPNASLLRRFGELVAEASSPIDDVRGTAEYRRHALAVVARRSLSWAWADLLREAPR